MKQPLCMVFSNHIIKYCIRAKRKKIQTASILSPEPSSMPNSRPLSSSASSWSSSPCLSQNPWRVAWYPGCLFGQSTVWTFKCEHESQPCGPFSGNVQLQEWKWSWTCKKMKKWGSTLQWKLAVWTFIWGMECFLRFIKRKMIGENQISFEDLNHLRSNEVRRISNALHIPKCKSFCVKKIQNSHFHFQTNRHVWVVCVKPVCHIVTIESNLRYLLKFNL